MLALLALAACPVPPVPEDRPGSTIEPIPEPSGGGGPLPTVGRIVHVRVGGDDDRPVLRAAIVTQVFGDQVANVTVFLDHANDRARHLPPAFYVIVDGAIAAGSSIYQGAGVGQWRWPARS